MQAEADALADNAFADRLDDELSLLEAQKQQFDRVAPRGVWESTLESARRLCKGRCIAVVGGDVALPWVEELLTGDIHFYASARPHGISNLEGLVSGVRNGKYAAVVQLKWSGHSDELRSACSSSGVACVYVPAVGKRSFVRALARAAGG